MHTESSPPAPRRRVLLVGWDAAEWRVLHPLLDAGLLPTLGGLVAGGAMGDLVTLVPTIAPLTWTSIATGVRADRHGILAEREPDPTSGEWRPISCLGRSAKAIWNVASQNGLRSIVVNWAATHPAEPIRGVCIDERITSVDAPPGAAWGMPGGCVHPAGLAAGLADLRFHPGEVPADSLLPFIPRLSEIELARDPRPGWIAAGLAASVTVQAVATELLEREAWDFAAVRYHLLEPLGQVFMRYRAPAGDGVPTLDADRYGGVIDAGCRLLDGMLGALLDVAGPDTTVILVSDHGFRSGADRPTPSAERAGPAVWHAARGVLVVSGPDVRPDQLIHGAGLLDIAPTVLGLLGLPAGADMPGRVLAEAFREPPSVGRIPSWEDVAGECGRHAPEDGADAWQEAEVIRQLVSLGYDASSPIEEADRAHAASQQDYHRALALLDDRDVRGAIAALRRVVASAPGHLRARLLLASSLLTDGATEECRELAAGLAADPRFMPYSELLLGMLAAKAGAGDEAIGHFDAAERLGDSNSFLLCQVAWVHLRASRHAESERAFRRAREIDADCRAAPLGLSILHSAQGRPAAAADEALVAIGRCYCWPEAHAQLGVALVGLRRFDRAIQAFETSIAQRPSAMAHEWLAGILTHVPGRAAAAAEHRAAARELREGRGPVRE